MFYVIKCVAAFIYDGFLLLGKAVNSSAKKISSKSNVSCDTETPWSFGSQFISRLKANSFHGLSGRIQFGENNGLRDNLTFFIVDRNRDSIDLVN